MKRLLITGARGEIGSAIAMQFEKQGYEIDKPNSEQLDLSSIENVHDYFDSYEHKIDAFIHCAGVNDPKRLDQMDVQGYERTMTINSTAMFAIAMHLAKKMLLNDGSAIVGVSSIYGSFSRLGRLAYSSSKHCMVGMIKSLALELADRGIRVNAVSPGFVATKLTYKNNTPEKIDEILQKVPLNKLATPSEIAQVVYFLCSESNGFITGQDIVADGGYTIGGFEK